VVGNDFKNLFGDNDFKNLFGDRTPEEGESRPYTGPPEPENRGARRLSLKEVKVIDVFEAVTEPSIPGLPSSQTFVLLRDKDGREFRIFVLRDVAIAISMGLHNEAPDRPFTHDLMKTILERVGATVEQVTIDDLWQDTFYARISISRNGETIDIDARPSDAIALGLRFRAPIYVAESVLEAAQQES
jgi:hypothetical protein